MKTSQEQGHWWPGRGFLLAASIVTILLPVIVLTSVVLSSSSAGFGLLLLSPVIVPLAYGGTIVAVLNLISCLKELSAKKQTRGASNSIAIAAASLIYLVVFSLVRATTSLLNLPF